MKSGSRLAALTLVSACVVLGGRLSAHADAWNSDQDKPNPWIEPVPPAPTPCNFQMTKQGNWNPVGESDKVEGTGSCPLDSGDDFQWYSNAALKGMEIWGYSYAWDDVNCHSDEASSADVAGVNYCELVYTYAPQAGCVADYRATFHPTFTWVLKGTPNGEAEYDGLMYGQFDDLVFDNPTCAKAEERFCGDRGEGVEDGSELEVEIPLPGGGSVKYKKKFKKYPDSFDDTDAVSVSNVKPNIVFTGDILHIMAKSKVRTYADEAGPLWFGTASECTAKIKNSDPQLYVHFTCKGAVSPSPCDQTTTSTYKKP